MRFSVRFLALGAVVAASPAMAQLGLGLGGQGGLGATVGGNVGAGANVGGVVNGVTGSLDNSVNRLDRTANGALGGTAGLQAATSADLESGAVVRDKRGHSIGVLQSVQGNVAVVAKGGQMLHVPLAALYRNASGLVTSMTKAQIAASASANASANANAHN